MKFARQLPVGPYIVDFAARARRLTIEVDGVHMPPNSRMTRAEPHFLEEQGYRVVRFSNRDVMTNIADVRRAIGVALHESEFPLPTFSPEGRGLSPA